MEDIVTCKMGLNENGRLIFKDKLTLDKHKTVHVQGQAQTLRVHVFHPTRCSLNGCKQAGPAVIPMANKIKSPRQRPCKIYVGRSKIVKSSFTKVRDGQGARPPLLSLTHLTQA